MKTNLFFFSFIVAISLFLGLSTSCKKLKLKCTDKLSIKGPYVVNEGDKFILKPEYEPATHYTNEHFFWTYPYTSSSNYFSGYENSVKYPNPVIFYDAGITHQGEYSFRVKASESKCQELTAYHTIMIKPKKAPCFDELTTETIRINESYSSGTIEKPYTYSLIDNPNEKDGFIVRLNMFPQIFELKFHIPIPSYSSAYKLRNSWNSNNGFKPMLNAEIVFSPASSGNHNYKIDDYEDEILYLKREGDVMYLTFCELVFIHESIPDRTVTISGKIKIDL